MKFGRRLVELAHPEWAEHYLAYEQLKRILQEGEVAQTANAEGAFLALLLGVAGIRI